MIFIDKNYNDAIISDNLHLLKSLPEITDNIINKLIEYNINFDIIKSYDQGSFLSNIPFPLQLIGYYILFNILFNFAMQNNIQNKLPNFNTNKNKPINNNDINIKFDDVAGCDESKFELMEVVDFLKNPDKFKNSGAKIPTGILLEGPPGTGKTLLARAVAGEAGVSFLSASGSEFIEMFVGVGASRVRNLFETAKKESPCVIFIDEIDAIGRQRGAGFNSGNDEREQTLNQILTNMDGFDKTSGIIVLAATNRVDILDNALTRPGRFDRKVVVPLPDTNGRQKIIELNLKNKNYDENIDIHEFAELTAGFSGADIFNMVNEAAILSIRYNLTVIDKKCVIDAYEKVTIGLPKLNDTRSEEVVELVAYHEAGHTLIALLFSDFFEVRKVTINANLNGAGGYTLFTEKSRFSEYPTKKYMLAKLMVALGGRAAEIVLYNNINNQLNSAKYSDEKIFNNIKNLDITTGASGDLQSANRLARNYINLFGFENGFGIFDETNSNLPFLGRDIGNPNNKISEYSMKKTDCEIERLLNNALIKTVAIIESNQDQLDCIANLLITKNNIEQSNLINNTISYY